MKCKPSFFKLISVELQNIFLIIIAFIFSIPMFVGMLSRDAPFVDMTLGESKMLLALFAIFVLFLPWPFVILRYRRVIYAFKYGVTANARLNEAVPMYSPYSKFVYEFDIDGQLVIHNIDLILTKKVKTVLESEDFFEIVFDTENNRSFIVDIYC